jgi:lysophospholipase L1-like esterase
MKQSNRMFISGLATLVAATGLLLAPIGHAQPRRVQPAAVPDAVLMPRPSEGQVAQAEATLQRLLSGLQGSDKVIFDSFPWLVDIDAREINTAIVPDLSPRFEEKHQANLAVARAGDIDVLFMGDSITDWWRNETGNYAGKPVFDQYFGNMKVANFGIAGDTTQGVLYRLQNGEGQGFSPKAVMLMIGTNNTRTNLAGEIAEGVGAVVLELQKDFPDAKILLLGVFPRSTNDSPLRPQIAEINSIISRLDDGDRVHYLDIGNIFLDQDGNIPTTIMSDGLHPTTAGYELWAQEVIGPLTDLMQD